jgi:hypothetical protein
MRPFRIGFVLLSLAGVAFSACFTQSPECETTGSGGSPGVVPSCENISIGYPSDDVCDICFHRECCAEMAACAAAGETSTADAAPVDHSLGNICLYCAIGGGYATGLSHEPMCEPVKDLAKAMSLCSAFRCQSECYPGLDPKPSSSSGSGGASSSSSSGSG